MAALHGGRAGSAGSRRKAARRGAGLLPAADGRRSFARGRTAPCRTQRKSDGPDRLPIAATGAAEPGRRSARSSSAFCWRCSSRPSTRRSSRRRCRRSGATSATSSTCPGSSPSYLLASTAVTPLYGKFADIHGRRVTMLIGIAIFIVGSIACALAPTMLALILARALQGLGGGGLIALAQTIIGDLVPPRERAQLPGLLRQRLHDLEPRRAGARRLLRRAPALVGDLLDQPAPRASRRLPSPIAA